jgi:hypothetical protein
VVFPAGEIADMPGQADVFRPRYFGLDYRVIEPNGADTVSACAMSLFTAILIPSAFRMPVRLLNVGLPEPESIL